MWYFVPLIPTKYAALNARYKEKCHSVNSIIEYIDSVNKQVRGQLLINNIQHENELQLTQEKSLYNSRLYVTFNHTNELKEILNKLRNKGFTDERYDKIHLYGEGWFQQ